MKIMLISDNHDTQTGMRLAGIDGVVAHEEQEVFDALNHAINNEEIAIILMTEKLVKLCPDLVYDLKLNRRRPLIVEIPDRHSAGRSSGAISKYIREAIGVKI